MTTAPVCNHSEINEEKGRSSEEKDTSLMNEKYSNRKHISRLKKQVTSLKTIVSELRKTRALADSGLECLEAIADTDISQFLKRFIQNQKN